MTKFKRYIRNIFSIAGLQWSDGSDPKSQKDGLIINESKIDTSSDRSKIADRQYMMSIKNFAENVVIPLVAKAIQFVYITIETGFSNNRVGNLPAGMPVSFINGKKYREITDLEFFVDPPTILIESSNLMSRSLPTETELEVGSELIFDVTTIHVSGIILNGNTDPNVSLQGDASEFEFIEPDGNIVIYPGTSNAQNHISTPLQTLLGDNIISSTVTWLEGTDPYFDADDNVRYEFDGVPRAAGSESFSETVSGYYAIFYGSGILGSSPINITAIRALPNVLINGDEVTVTIPAGDVEFYFYIPDTNIATIFHEVETNTYITQAFSETLVPMEDAAGNVVQYKELKLVIGGVGYLNDAILKLTIS